MEVTISPAGRLRGIIHVPGDKSISHRAVMFGSIARGITEIENFLPSADCLSTISCFKAMGIEFETGPKNKLMVFGKGLKGLIEPADILDAGNSGTTIRLILGILAGQEFFSVVSGDSSLRQRPMARVTEPLRKMGARIWGREKGRFAPIAVKGGNLKSIDYVSGVASAQVKSSILLAGLYSEGETSVIEPAKSRDHTERILRHFGADISVNGLKVTIKGGQRLVGQRVIVPGDISSAAFFMVAASIIQGSEILLKDVGLNPTRDGIIEVLKKMGAQIEIIDQREVSGEPVGDILVRGSSLHGTTVEGDLVPRLIDEIPVLAVAAAVAEGETLIRDAAELKVKESNRIATVANELRKMGASVEELPDGLRIDGGKPLLGAQCESYGDHRIAMAMGVAGLAASGSIKIMNAECVNVSFPGFWEVLKNISL